MRGRGGGEGKRDETGEGEGIYRNTLFSNRNYDPQLRPPPVLTLTLTYCDTIAIRTLSPPECHYCHHS